MRPDDQRAAGGRLSTDYPNEMGISRGRDDPLPFGFGPPPAQIPASGITALGSYLGYVAAKRTSG